MRKYRKSIQFYNLGKFRKFIKGESNIVLTKSTVRLMLWFPVGLIAIFVIYQHLRGFISF